MQVVRLRWRCEICGSVSEVESMHVRYVHSLRGRRSIVAFSSSVYSKTSNGLVCGCSQ